MTGTWSHLCKAEGCQYITFAIEHTETRYTEAGDYTSAKRSVWRQHWSEQSRTQPDVVDFMPSNLSESVKSRIAPPNSLYFNFSM